MLSAASAPILLQQTALKLKLTDDFHSPASALREFGWLATEKVGQKVHSKIHDVEKTIARWRSQGGEQSLEPDGGLFLALKAMSKPRAL